MQTAVTSTFLLQNLPLATLYPNIIDKELLEEMTASQMSGPFTIREVMAIFGRTSPVGLVEKYPGDGKWQMIQHLLKCDKQGYSMNDWINSADFPTLYYLAATVASYVSSSLSFIPSNIAYAV